MLETLACSGVLLGAYVVLLERRVKFRWCRSYLIASMALAALIPLLRIPVWPGKVVTVTPVVDMPQEWVGAEVVAEPVFAITPEMCGWVLYGLGVMLMLSLMGWQIMRIGRLRRDAEISSCDGFTLVRTRQKIASFSFFRSIYVWNKTPPQEMEAILMHEASHIAHRHSLERVAMECLKAVLWWNPFVWIASRRLTEAEEFEADSDVLDSGYDVTTYINTIFKQLFGYSPEIANGLRDSLTKKRFKMMTTQTKSRYGLLRLAGTLPAVIGLLCAFSFTSRAAVVPVAGAEMSAGEEVVDPAPASKGNCKVSLVIIKEMGDGRFSSENRAEGAIVKLVGEDKGAVAGKDGKVEMEVPQGKVLEVSMIGCKTRSVTVPETAEFSQFMILESEGKPEPESVVYIRDKDGVKQTPLYIVDGLEITGMEDIDASSIDNMNVLKGESATALYGDRGKNGVVVITTNRAVKAKVETVKANSDGSIQTDDMPFLVAETMPLFQGGNLNTFRQWVQSQVKYPAKELAAGIGGRVVLSFVVNTDGSVSDVQMLQSPDKVFSDEARRVVESSSGMWTAGEQRGKKVRVKYTLPVDFRAVGTKAETPQEVAAATDKPFRVVEKMPKFEGRDINAFRQWVQTQVRYPAEALKNNVSGRVVVDFQVGSDGRVTPGKVLMTPDRLLSEEVLRVIAKSPNWTPGEQGGKAVTVVFTIPINFGISTSKGMQIDKSDAPKGSVDEVVVVSYGDEKK